MRGEKSKQREKVMDKAISSFTRPRTQFLCHRQSFRWKKFIFSKNYFQWRCFLLWNLFLNSITTNSIRVDKNIRENSENFTVWRLLLISSSFPNSKFMAMRRPFSKNRSALAILPLSRDGRAFMALPRGAIPKTTDVRNQTNIFLSLNITEMFGKILKIDIECRLTASGARRRDE